MQRIYQYETITWSCKIEIKRSDRRFTYDGAKSRPSVSVYQNQIDKFSRFAPCD